MLTQYLERQTRVVGELSLLGSAFCMALTSVLLRRLQFEIGVISLNGFRSLFALVVPLAVVLGTGGLDKIGSISGTALVYLTISVILGIAFGDTIYFYGIKLVGTIRALPAMNIYPVYMAVLAAIFLGEPITVHLLLGTALVISGLVLVLLPKRAALSAALTQVKADRLGRVMVLVAPLFWAGSTAMLKIGLAEADVTVAATIRLAIASLILLGSGAMTRSGLQLREYRGSILLGIMAAGAVSGLSSMLFLNGVHIAGASKAAVLSSTSPIFGVPLSAIGGEKITWQIALGTVISIAGIWIVTAG